MTGGEPIEVQNVKYRSGASANRWRYTVLEATADDNGNVTLDYAKPTRYENPNRNRTEAYYTLRSGVYTEMGSHDPTLHNLDLSLAASVSGKTFDIKSILKDEGFRWDRDGKKWVR